MTWVNGPCLRMAQPPCPAESRWRGRVEVGKESTPLSSRGQLACGISVNFHNNPVWRSAIAH